MKTVGEVLKLSVAHVGDARPRHEVELLIAQALGISRLDLYLQFDRPVDEAELATIRPELSRLRKSEPFAYLSGKAPFFYDEFIVSKDVLIPRPETETLVEEAKNVLSLKKEGGVLFDLCTGCGCVGLSLKKLFPDWHVVLSDISQEALLIAKQNAEALSLSVELLLGDLFAPFFSRKAHCIVANPPYLSIDEWEKADLSLKQYEPKIALVGGETGLEWYERFFSSAQEYMHSGSTILMEIGSTQASAVLALANRFGFTDSTIIKDLGGRDRVIHISLETRVAPIF